MIYIDLIILKMTEIYLIKSADWPWSKSLLANGSLDFKKYHSMNFIWNSFKNANCKI